MSYIIIKESISFCPSTLKKNPQVLTTQPLGEVNNNGWSALIWCAINGCEEVASTLLAASANYLTADNEGRRWGEMEVKTVEFCKRINVYTDGGGVQTH